MKRFMGLGIFLSMTLLAAGALAQESDSAKAKAEAKAAAKAAVKEAARGAGDKTAKPAAAPANPAAPAAAPAQAAPAVVDANAKAQAVALEQEKHLRRLAKIERIASLAQQKGNAELTDKAAKLRSKEMQRHERTLKRIEQGNLGKHLGQLKHGDNPPGAADKADKKDKEKDGDKVKGKDKVKDKVEEKAKEKADKNDKEKENKGKNK